MQSPIDIQPTEAITFEKLDKFTVKLEALSSYDPAQAFELTNTGHSGLLFRHRVALPKSTAYIHGL